MSFNLRLLQFADSAFPISGYTHSWGLEAAIARGLVHDPQTLERWTFHWLRRSLGPLEGVLVAASVREQMRGNPAGLRHLNELAHVSIMPPTIRNASQEMGKQMLALAATWQWSAAQLQPHLQDPSEGWHHPIVFGLLGAIAGAEPEDVLTAYLHQSALGMISAGARVIPVGHTHAQQVMTYLQEEIGRLVDELKTLEPESAGAGCPFYEVLCDEQTRLYSRVYRS